MLLWARVRRRRGVTLLELVLTSLILAFIVAAASGLLIVGQKQQAIARGYSIVQTDLREALRHVTRTLRHGGGLLGTGSGALAGRTTGPASVVVVVPEPSAVGGNVQVAFYVSNGTLYWQRSVAAGGLDAQPHPLMDGVQAMSLRYFTNTGIEVNSSPLPIHQVEVTLTGVRTPAVTTVKAQVMMRNTLTGL